MPDGGQAELRSVVDEVFIKPVRSVLLVDDEYPTLDKMLEGFLDKQDVWSIVSAKAKDNSSRVSNILAFCRDPERNWHVDVHDGENVSFYDEEKLAESLHQSDLLFLDFHLDGDSSDTTKCMIILRHLSNSDHFNLVVVVTKEELEPSFLEILPHFVQASFSKSLGQERKNKIQSFIDDWSDETGEPIAENLANSFSLGAYLYLASFGDIDLNDKGLLPYISGFKAIIETAPNGAEEKDVLIWSLAAAEQKLNMAGANKHECSSLSADQKWLCSRNLFMTIVKKSEENQAELILEALTAALTDWNPTANRLILSKLRSEIEARGLSIGQEVFTQRHMQALWLKNLVTSGSEERRSEIDVSVSRYGEALVSLVSTPIRDVVTRSLQLEDVGGVDQRVQSAFGVNITTDEAKERAAIEHNIIVSNSRINGWHIEPGHIFKFAESYWIVLTPVCDLVPSQNRQRAETMGGVMPFKAVKLRVISNHGKALKNADHNLTTFIYDNEEPICLHFLTGDSSNSEVHWNEFFAKNKGKFSGDAHTLSVATTTSEDGEIFQNNWGDVEIVAQLRYEYAIHLLQTLGARTSRVGLGFVKAT